MTYDSQSIQTIYNKGFATTFGAVITLIGALVIMLHMDWRLTLVALAVFPPVLWAIRSYGVMALIARPNVRLVTAVCLALGAFAINGAQAEPTDDSLQVYVVRILWGDEQNLGGAGVYLGKGLVITAAHVAGSNTRGVRIDGLDVPAKLVKTGTFPLLDLSLVAVDEERLPVSLRLRRMPLCQQPPQIGTPVIVAAPQGITRSRIMAPLLLSADLRWKIPGAAVSVRAPLSPLLPATNLRWKVAPVISEGTTDGKSGSGVFDADKKCLLGILSQKITNTAEHRDVGTYFVPASTIHSFVPTGTHW